MEPCGDKLLDSLDEARHEVMIVAPFIKLSALERVIGQLDSCFPIRVLTRWRLDEILSGVSDIEIWETLKIRPNASLHLQASLHAKYYRVDNRRFIGSANLTNAGMGWNINSNIEILVEVSENHVSDELENELWNNSILVTQEIYEQTKISVTQCIHDWKITEDECYPATSATFNLWRPQLRSPQELFVAYRGGLDLLSNASSEAAQLDLLSLSPPQKLSEHEFNGWVRLQLMQHPEFNAINDFGKIPRRFGEVRDFLHNRGVENPTRQWQTWMRWLGYFFPNKFKFNQPKYSEIFQSK